MTGRHPVDWLAYSLGAVLGTVTGLVAAELSFMFTSTATGNGWDDAAVWQYLIAGLAFLGVAMTCMFWVGRRVRVALRRGAGGRSGGGS